MFAVKDLETLKNLGGLLTIPLFSAACLLDIRKMEFSDSDLLWIRDRPQEWGVFGWIFLIVIIVVVVFCLLEVIHWLVLVPITRIGVFNVILPLLGLSCLTMGVFVLPAFVSKG
jgi:hypothetical protein